MKVNFEHSSVTKGMLRKTTYPVVTVTVDFTAEELALIKREKYQDHVITETVPVNARADRNEQIYYCYVKTLMKGSYEFMCENNVDAKYFEELMLDSLKNLKLHLDGGTEAGESKSIEL